MLFVLDCDILSSCITSWALGSISLFISQKLSNMNIDIMKCGSSLLLKFMGLLKHPNLPFNLPNAFSIIMHALDNLQPKYCFLSSFLPFGYSFIKNGSKRYVGFPKMQMGTFNSPSTICFSQDGTKLFRNFWFKFDWRNILES